MKLKNFAQLNVKEGALVLEWRNHASVAAFMKQKNITKTEHLNFMESLKHDTSKEYFLVFANAIPIGVIDFIEIVRGFSCEFGIYQSPFLKGYGEILMQKVLDYAFNVLKVKELRACAFNANTKAIDLYLRFGFEITKRDARMCYFNRGDEAK
ncbi:UDP-4-amino-4,6-dideoxy-N-acetyl-beta-L-altrosamine N-acetyltransferase [Helicobacter turcicus]|uniref:UDP-4-amino-4, 6-dideoxy-N-acetyl-beta-L-altrosamine N-acetyltransferase n=1 Tax=Helicobacter turcicus TaxID=2867412 RepID=UPI001F403F8B|nr:UDP-4-amino-4,6-dideoxy-N-acetyl-beta-L-altrosamine N-acetyltransferase [Helicobacter turcicus]